LRERPKKALPRVVDLSTHCPPVEDQADIGSCTAHAVVGLLEYLWMQTHKKHLDASRLFVYKATRNLLGWTGDTGAFVRTAMKSLRVFGACPEDYWPYDAVKFEEEPTSFCYAFGASFKSLVYYRIDPTLADIRKSLAAGVPFAFGFTCYESIDNPSVAATGRIPFPNGSERVVGGHAVMAVGYDDAKKHVIIQNSWGRGWGNKGFGYLPYAYFEMELADDCWCLIKATYEDLEDAVG
jgi:C1A family cysteine protease